MKPKVINITTTTSFSLTEYLDFAAVTNWVVNYFTPRGLSRSDTVNEALRGASAVVVTDKMPFILQHDGHSRTIIGYEILKSGVVDLLTFDPSMSASFFGVECI
jgi:hypothetical protein